MQMNEDVYRNLESGLLAENKQTFFKFKEN